MDVAAVKVLPENARDFFAISYFDAKNAHTDLSEPIRRKGCVVL